MEGGTCLQAVMAAHGYCNNEAVPFLGVNRSEGDVTLMISRRRSGGRRRRRCGGGISAV